MAQTEETRVRVEVRDLDDYLEIMLVIDGDSGPMAVIALPHDDNVNVVSMQEAFISGLSNMTHDVIHEYAEKKRGEMGMGSN